jgi:hypothetical protein
MNTPHNHAINPLVITVKGQLTDVCGSSAVIWQGYASRYGFRQDAFVSQAITDDTPEGAKKGVEDCYHDALARLGVAAECRIIEPG